MKRTLGGDRIGSGRKMQVETKHYERSTHDLSRVWRNTQTAGTLIPFMAELALVGDTWDIDMDLSVLTPPTVGALFGTFKVQLDVYQCPIRLYNSLLHNNALKIAQNIEQVIFPTYTLRADAEANTLNENFPDTRQINPSSLPAYLGVRGVGINRQDVAAVRDFNALKLLSYWDIYKNYYAAKFENEGVVIDTREELPDWAITSVEAFPIEGNETPVQRADQWNSGETVNMPLGGGIEIAYTEGDNPIRPELIYFKVTNNPDGSPWSTWEAPMTEIFKEIVVTPTSITAQYPRLPEGMYVQAIIWWRYATMDELVAKAEIGLVRFNLENIDNMREMILGWNSRVQAFNINDQTGAYPYHAAVGAWQEDKNKAAFTMNGLGVKTYNSDLFNNWLDAEEVMFANEKSNMAIVGNQLQMETFILAKKIYEYYNDILVSGSTYDDWLDVTYDETRYTRAESPMYMGGMQQRIVFQEVISNTATPDQPLGSIGARGKLANNKKGGKVHIKVNEPSYIMGLISITPELDYSQGNKWDSDLKTLDDIHKPAFDQIGFQDSINEQRAWWSTNWDDVQNKWLKTSAGKVPAWLNYMTATNELYGNFAINNAPEAMKFMVLDRNYTPARVSEMMVIDDLTTYIDPVKYNNIFAETQLNAMNFWTQIGLDIEVRRKMSAKIMPRV